jgi:hypothetical protein
VGADDLALLDHGDGNLAKLFGQLGAVLEQLEHLDRAGHASWPGTDDGGTYFNALVFRVCRPGDDALGIKRRWKLGGRYGRHGLVLSGIKLSKA